MSDANDHCYYVPFQEYNWKGLVVFQRHFNGTDGTNPIRRPVTCHGLAIPWNFPVICLFAAMVGVTVWICLDVMVQAVTTFKRWSTVYFWSIIFTAFSVILYAIIVALMFFNVNQGKFRPTTVLYPISWIFTNTGAITVLYSRLHLVINAPRTLKWLAYFLVGVGIPFQVFIVVAAQGNSKGKFMLGMKVHNVQYRLEVLVSVVEIFLATAYTYFFTIRFMKDGTSGFKGTGKGNQLKLTFILLILGTTFVVAGDIALIAVWLEGYFLVRLAFAPFIYGTKLKVEFLILNCLTGMTQQRAELRNISIPTGNHTNEATLAAAEMAATTVLENAAAADLDRVSTTDRDFRAYGISAADWDDVEDGSIGGSSDIQPKGNVTAFSSSVATRSHEAHDEVLPADREKAIH